MKKVFLLLCVLFLIVSCAKQKVSTQPPQAEKSKMEQSLNQQMEQNLNQQEEKKELKQPETLLSSEASMQDQKEEPKKTTVEEVSPTMIAKAQTTMTDATNEQSVLSKMIHFDFDKYDIKKEAQEVLKEIAAYLKANPEIRIIIEGHCDERGTREYNLVLGMRRAQAAKKYLVDLGIDEKRIETISYGKDRPLIDEHNENAWAKNRRCEFKRIK
jgi:peptidoglycan-associated lipoprotein